jgi:hypothetical protein
MLVIIVKAVVGQSESGGVRAGWPQSPSLMEAKRQVRVALSRGRCCLVTPTNSSIPSPSNSLRKLPVLYPPRFVQAPAFYRPPLRV